MPWLSSKFTQTDRTVFSCWVIRVYIGLRRATSLRWNRIVTKRNVKTEDTKHIQKSPIPLLKSPRLSLQKLMYTAWYAWPTRNCRPKTGISKHATTVSSMLGKMKNDFTLGKHNQQQIFGEAFLYYVHILFTLSQTNMHGMDNIQITLLLYIFIPCSK